MNIREHLKRNRLIMDGAMGTYYADRYARRGEPSEIGNFDAPLAVRAIHMEYIKAGAGLIRTNTFASNYESLKRCGYGGESHNPRTVVAIRTSSIYSRRYRTDSGKCIHRGKSAS